MLRNLPLAIALSLPLCCVTTAQCQSHHSEQDLHNKKNVWKKDFILPPLLIGAGVFGSFQNDIINREEIREERNNHLPNFHTKADNYLQYAPIAAVYGLNAIGVKGEHNIANQTALLIKSEVLLTAVVYPIKKITAEERPDTKAHSSFPSGHTAQAFAAATFLHKEYGKKNILYSIAGYGTASCVGAMRILNNRHWISDVLAGAGIGILTTNLVYLTHQNKWGKTKTLKAQKEAAIPKQLW